MDCIFFYIVFMLESKSKEIVMYQIMALCVGVLVALMISVNGELSSALGIYSASLLIRILGSIFAFFMAKAQNEARFPKKMPLYLYLGGCVGALTTLFNNYAFAHISVTAIMALSLFAEATFSLMIDTFGWFHIQKRPLKKATFFCLLFSLIGIIILLVGAKTNTILAIFITLLSGSAVVLSRMMNIRLSVYCGKYGGSFVNQLMGIPMFALLLLFMGKSEIIQYTSIQLSSIPIWAYFGGAIGVVIVYISNIVIPKISAFQMSLLSFVGQVFTGIFVDILFQNEISYQTFLGGLFIVLGIGTNIIMKHPQKEKN